MLKHFLNFEKNKQILDGLLDKDGLVETSHLVFQIRSGRAEFSLKKYPAIRVFPKHPIESVASHLAAKPALWRIARIGIQAAPSIVGRASIYGVDFQKAVSEALAKGFIKSRFQVPMPERFSNQGYVADLLVHVGTSLEQGGKLINFEAWQDPGHDSTVFYLHGIMPAAMSHFVHFDGASIEFSPEDRARLFQEGRKLKGAYRKHFRLDGRIDLTEAFALARKFYPVDELTEEYFLAAKA